MWYKKKSVTNLNTIKKQDYKTLSEKLVNKLLSNLEN